MENKHWKYNRKPFKEGNWKAFTDVVDASFPNDVEWNWIQVQNKWNKMKKIYEIEKKKIKVIGASNQPWFEHFNNIFFGIAKINGIHNAIEQGVRVMNFEIEVVNVSDEDDVQTPQLPNSP